MKLSKGFTLIEMIVVMAVFMLVIGAAVTIFISIVREQRKILSEQELINQTSYVIEYMSKALRMAEADESGECLTEGGEDHGGWIYMLTKPDPSTGFYRGIVFKNASNNSICQEFFLDEVANPDRPEHPFLILKELKSADGNRNTTETSAVALTSTRLEISSIKFSINGGSGAPGGTSYASGSDNAQPRITILLEAKIAGDIDQPTRKIQTTVSQRNLNKVIIVE